ncbi:NUDIX hydrolase [Xenorhabdus sp. Sc-CR9]|uniref:NUDIX hydrolase n=1 Tax=Xenorhabdus sp. Sc-CR9 TaxID=2584468 RepID=UPI001F38ACA4|nr:NUDIX hydrolase [Xenorhabdus sp. Sc-CR9]
MKQEIKKLLANYSTEYLIELLYINEMMALLEVSQPFDSKNVAGHFTASAWILSHDKSKVLLTKHAKLGKWFQLGGHIEPTDRTFLDACVREATEESGIVGLSKADAFIIDVDMHPIPENYLMPEHPHYDISMCFVAPKDAEIVCSPESLQLSWVPVSEVGGITDDAAILRMVSKTNLLFKSAA